MSESASIIELRYFSPFDITKIPHHILLQVFNDAFAAPYIPAPYMHHGHVTLSVRLLVDCDHQELKNGIRRRLIMEMDG